MAGATGLEPATSCVTGRRSNRLNYAPAVGVTNAILAVPSCSFRCLATPETAVTIQRPEVTSCNFTAPIATFGALSNCSEVLSHPNCTQITEVGSREFACFVAQDN